MLGQARYHRRIIVNLAANPLYVNTAMNNAVISTCMEILGANDGILPSDIKGKPGLVAKRILGYSPEDIRSDADNAQFHRRLYGSPYRELMRVFYGVQTMTKAILTAMECCLDSTKEVPPQSSDWYNSLSMCRIMQITLPYKEIIERASRKKFPISGYGPANDVGEYTGAVETELCLRHLFESERTTWTGKLNKQFLGNLVANRTYDIYTLRMCLVIIGRIKQYREATKHDPEYWEREKQNLVDALRIQTKVDHDHDINTLRAKLNKAGKLRPGNTLNTRLTELGKELNSIIPTPEQVAHWMEDLLEWDDRVIINVITDIRLATMPINDGRGKIPLPPHIVQQGFTVFAIFNTYLEQAYENLYEEQSERPLLFYKAFKPLRNQPNYKRLKASRPNDFREYCHAALDEDGIWRGNVA